MVEMDDTEDDARYPPNPYPPSYRHAFPSSHRPKLPVRNAAFPPLIGRGFVEDNEEDDEDDDEDEQHNIDQAMEEAEEDDDDDDDDDDSDDYRRIRGDDDDSSESRGKRRKLDKLALGFEFAPRVPMATPSFPVAAQSKPSVRNSPADWSEHATFVLLEAWGDLYIQNGRKSLRSDEWMEVARKVSQASKTPRSDGQCRNRLDTLKKKYKKEKARMTETVNSSSKWVYFKKMESLMSSPSPPQAAQQPPSLPCGVDAGEYVFAGSKVYLNRANGLDEMRDSPGDTGSEDDDDVDDESDGLPPKRGKVSGNSESSSFRMLADSIQKFGEIYEKIENNKRQQMAELEKMRREFHRDLEVQKRQILERAQVEISKIRQGEGEEEEEEEEEEGEEEEEEIDASVENLSG